MVSAVLAQLKSYSARRYRKKLVNLLHCKLLVRAVKSRPHRFGCTTYFLTGLDKTRFLLDQFYQHAEFKNRLCPVKICKSGMAVLGVK